MQMASPDALATRTAAVTVRSGVVVPPRSLHEEVLRSVHGAVRPMLQIPGQQVVTLFILTGHSSLTPGIVTICKNNESVQGLVGI